MTPFESDVRFYRDAFHLLAMPILFGGYMILGGLRCERGVNRLLWRRWLFGWTALILSAMLLTGYFGAIW